MTPAARPESRAPSLSSPLVIPAWNPAIPYQWEFNPNQDRLLRLANTVADTGLMPANPAGKSITTILQKFLSDWGDAARPQGLCDLCLTLTDDLADLEIDPFDYLKKYQVRAAAIFPGKIPEGEDRPDLGRAPDGQSPDKYNEFARPKSRSRADLCLANSTLSGLFITFNPASDGMHQETIGPALEALDQWNRVGQTVLSILDDALKATVHSINPRNSLIWAGNQYWQGEEDESNRVAEELEDVKRYHQQKIKTHRKENPNDPVEESTDEDLIRENICHFLREDLDNAIPEKWHKQCHPLKEIDIQLSTGWVNGIGQPEPLVKVLSEDRWTLEDAVQQWPAIRAACLRIQELLPAWLKTTRTDNNICQNVAPEMCPLMLRLSDNDPLPQIADDTWNDLQQGDICMDLNTLFLWHDGPSLARALHQCSQFLQLLRACEDLIKLLAKKPESIRIPIHI